MAEKPTIEEAQKLLDYLQDLDPAWRERVVAMMEERGSDPLRILGLLIGNTLEMGLHMQVPDIPQLLDDFIPAGQTHNCPQCGNPYQLLYPGQPYCGPDCAAIARGETRRVQGELVETVVDPDDYDPETALRQLPSTSTSFKNRRKING